MNRFGLLIFVFCLMLSLRASQSEKLTMWIIGDPHIYSIQEGYAICDYRNLNLPKTILQITGLTIIAIFGNVSTSVVGSDPTMIIGLNIFFERNSILRQYTVNDASVNLPNPQPNWEIGWLSSLPVGAFTATQSSVIIYDTNTNTTILIQQKTTSGGNNYFNLFVLADDTPEIRSDSNMLSTGCEPGYNVNPPEYDSHCDSITGSILSTTLNSTVATIICSYDYQYDNEIGLAVSDAATGLDYLMTNQIMPEQITTTTITTTTTTTTTTTPAPPRKTMWAIGYSHIYSASVGQVDCDFISSVNVLCFESNSIKINCLYTAAPRIMYSMNIEFSYENFTFSLSTPINSYFDDNGKYLTTIVRNGSKWLEIMSLTNTSEVNSVMIIDYTSMTSIMVEYISVNPSIYINLFVIEQNRPELLNNVGVLINGCPSRRRKRALATAVDCSGLPNSIDPSLDSSTAQAICEDDSLIAPTWVNQLSNTIANLNTFKNVDSILFLNGGANSLATMWVIGDPHILSFRKQTHEECHFNGEIECFKSNFVNVKCSAGRIFFPNKTLSTRTALKSIKIEFVNPSFGRLLYSISDPRRKLPDVFDDGTKSKLNWLDIGYMNNITSKNRTFSSLIINDQFSNTAISIVQWANRLNSMYMIMIRTSYVKAFFSSGLLIDGCPNEILDKNMIVDQLQTNSKCSSTTDPIYKLICNMDSHVDPELKDAIIRATKMDHHKNINLISSSARFSFYSNIFTYLLISIMIWLIF